jgi:hypothetical protein
MQIHPTVKWAVGETEFVGVGRRRRLYARCVCRCGREALVIAQNLKNGTSRECLSCSHASKLGSTPHNKTHGESHVSAEHRTWRAMHERCYQRTHVAYDRYGGRGIRVCDAWTGPNGYVQFLNHMGRRPSPKHSIDRIDPDGNYSPSNCRWSTLVEQANNKRNNRRIEAFGRTQTLAQWSAEFGVSESLIRARIGRLRWPAERAVSEPAVRGRNQTSALGVRSKL